MRAVGRGRELVALLLSEMLDVWRSKGSSWKLLTGVVIFVGMAVRRGELREDDGR